ALVKIISVPFYAIRKQVNVRVLGFLLAGGIPGVLAGSFLLENLKRGDHVSVLYVALGALIVSTALLRLYSVFRPGLESSLKDRSRLLPWFALPIGAEVGFSSAGAGALGSLLLLWFTPLAAAEVVGTDLCFGLGLSGVGSIIHFGAGNYDSTL